MDEQRSGTSAEGGTVVAAYVGVVAVVAGVIAAVLGLSVPDTVGDEGEEAVCSLYDHETGACEVERPDPVPPAPTPDPPPFAPDPPPLPPVPEPTPVPEPPPHVREGWPGLPFVPLPTERGTTWHESVEEVEHELGLVECEDGGVSPVQPVQVEVDMEPGPDGTTIIHEIRIHNPSDFPVDVGPFELAGAENWGMLHTDATRVPAGGSEVIAPGLFPGPVKASDDHDVLLWSLKVVAVSELWGVPGVQVGQCATHHAGGWWVP